MLNKNKIMAIAFYCLFVVDILLSFQVAIPVQDFCSGNSLVLISRDGNGIEQVAGCVSFDEGKTEFSQDEISVDNPNLSSINEQKTSIVTDVDHNKVEQGSEGLIYLYFEVDPAVNIIRVLVMKNNFLADNPFDVVEFSSASLLDEDDEDDFFCDDEDDELSHFDLTDIKGTEAVELSNYDKVLLGVYALWEIQSSKAKQTYRNVTSWFASQDEE